MATKKRIVKSNNQELIEEVTSDPKHPLVFISHDTRDAELAEEFSNLLKSASAGALKSFRSSDKKGATGIEYGQEWYQAIMNKLYEASEVVCLLTQRSVDRPWILYEAGVAKGKSDRKVIGIALGLHTSVAFTGPFAQFQNNDGSVESVTKLVLDLVRKVPGLDPDQQLVSQLVEKFDKRSKEIIMKIQKQPKEDKKESSEKIVAKLFEEVKIMYEALPAKIENRIDPEFRRRKRKMQPFMIEELLHIAKISEDPAIEFMIILSFYKEDYPWFYEIGVVTYEGFRGAKTIVERKKLAMSFTRAIDLIGHPMFREMHSKLDDHMFYKEIRHFLHRSVENLVNNGKLK